MRFNEDVPTADEIRTVLFNEGRVEELEPMAVVSFGDMLELFLAGSDELGVRNEETMAVVTVLVIKVEFRDWLRMEDGMIRVVLFTEDINSEL